MTKPPKITIIGNGRFGKYLAKQIQLQTKTKPRLLEAGCQNPAYRTADITILAVPIRDLLECVQNILPYLKKDSILMDTCSVKTLPFYAIIKAAETLGRTDLHIVGTHPLFGPQSAPHTCAGQRVALCTQEGHRIPEEAYNLWETQLKTVIIQVTPEEHDKQMATQVLNHFIGQVTQAIGIERVTLSTKTHKLPRSKLRGFSRESRQKPNRHAERTI